MRCEFQGKGAGVEFPLFNNPNGVRKALNELCC